MNLSSWILGLGCFNGAPSILVQQRQEGYSRCSDEAAYGKAMYTFTEQVANFGLTKYDTNARS